MTKVFSLFGNESQCFGILAKKVNEPLLKVGARKSETALPSTNGLGITSNAICYILLRPSTQLALTLQVVLLRRVPLHEASSVFYAKTRYPRYFFKKNLPRNCTLSTPGVK
jgi:hypothetical protein